MDKRINCGKCKVSHPYENFYKKKNGDLMKICKFCTDSRRNNYNKKKNSFVCDFEDCDYKCSTNGNLKRHKKQVHFKIKDFVCDFEDCDYKCSTNGHLKTHKKQVHFKIKDFVCDFEDCDYKCSTNGTLKTHKKMVHFKIKDFVCDFEGCDYKCSTNSDLNSHKKQVHFKIKDVVCNWEDCDFKCSTNSTLKKHKKMVHFKIKDFVCDFEDCDYKCSTNGNLKTHKKFCTGKFIGSSGEYKIKTFLESKNIDYNYDSSFNSLKSNSGGLLRFDFVISLPFGEYKMIEYDGMQHTEPVCFGGISEERAAEKFKKQQENDKIKDEYCLKNGYKMLRINYTDKERIEELLNDFIYKVSKT